MTTPTLILFARYPMPGEAKTRLIPALGAAGAARLQDAMTRHTLRAAAGAARVEVRFVGGDAEAMRHRYGPGVAYLPQGEGDLGARLSRAARDVGGPFVVVGTDCPAVTSELLRAAIGALAAHEVIVGPATDGGYWLLGARRWDARLFDGIEWSTPRVLAQTRAAAAAAGLSLGALATLSDVDVPDDLAAVPRYLANGPPPAYAPERIAITGATGCLGQRFLAHVLATLPAVRVTALVRDASASRGRAAFGALRDRHAGRITWVTGDLSGLTELPRHARRDLAEADGGLWHFAATTALHATSPAVARAAWAVNDAGTASLLRLLASSDRPGPLFHLSTAYVCGRRRGVVREHELSDADGFRNPYEASKHVAERRVRAALEAGLGGIVFRPSLVVAVDDADAGDGGHVAGVMRDALRAARAGHAVTLPLPRDAGVNAVDADWVSRALLGLAGYHAARRTYHLTAPSEADVGQVLDVAGDAARPLIDAAIEPHAERRGRAIDRLLDRRLAPFRPYVGAAVSFDRRNLQLDWPDLADAGGFDVRGLLASA